MIAYACNAHMCTGVSNVHSADRGVHVGIRLHGCSACMGTMLAYGLIVSIVVVSIGIFVSMIGAV